MQILQIGTVYQPYLSFQANINPYATSLLLNNGPWGCVPVIFRITDSILGMKKPRFKKNNFKNSQNFWSKKIGEVGKFSKNRKIENFENRNFFEGFRLKFFEFSNFGIFGFSIFRKISIEILRKFFDFQNFRFSDFPKNFQLRRFFSTKNFASFPLIFFKKVV